MNGSSIKKTKDYKGISGTDMKIPANNFSLP